MQFFSLQPTKYMVGSENGSIYMCNKKAKNPNEKITHTYLGHHGPIYALQVRNLALPLIFPRGANSDNSH